MKKYLNSVITGSGSFIPSNVIKNSHFLDKVFYDVNRKKLDRPMEEIVDKFVAITDIEERRWIDDDMVNSDMGKIAAERALEQSGIDKNDIDYIITAHNFGDISYGTNKSDIMPSLSAKIKNKLGIKSNAIPYDMLYGCPGWIEGLRMGDQFIKAGIAKNILVIATETLSRIIDPFDRDSMIFADGAGAVVLSAVDSDEKYGILAHNTISDNDEDLNYLFNDRSFNPDHKQNELYIRMAGRKIYEYALTKVPAAIKKSIDDAGLHLDDTSKLLIHQANGKMDEQILKRFLRLYKGKVADNYMPMTIQKLGNSSVATVPTMFDLINKGELEDHQFNSGDNIVLASVGAGMAINSMVYKFK